MNTLKLAFTALLGRAFIGVIGVLQLKIVLPTYGLNTFSIMSSAMSFMSIGLIIESGIAWNLRVNISRLAKHEIPEILRNTVRKSLYMSTPLIGMALVTIAKTDSTLLKLICIVALLTGLNLIFVPWMRLFEGIGKQEIVVYVQIITSLTIFLLVQLTRGKIGFLQFFTLVCSNGFITMIILFLMYNVTNKYRNMHGASYSVQKKQATLFNTQSLVVVFCMTLMFSFFPFIYHFYKDSQIIAATGVQVRLYSILIGVFGVISTQYQVQIMKKPNLRNVKYIQSQIMAIMIMLFAITDLFLQIFLLNQYSFGTFIEGIGFGFLISLVWVQLEDSAKEINLVGLKIQQKSFILMTFSFFIACYICYLSDLSLVWFTSIIYFFGHVKPLKKRAKLYD